MRDASASLPFDLRSLEIFLSVCETGAMSSAARALGLTQPAVSLAISDLERKLGHELFDRTVRPLAVTLAGGLLRQRASALLAEARQIGPLLRETEHGKLPLIRVGLVDSLARALTAPLASYLASKADEVWILSGLTASHASDLLTRRLDLFLGVDDLEDWAGLERWQLAKEPYVLLLPAGTEAPRTVGALRKLAQSQPLIRFSSRSQTGLDIESHIRRLGLDVPRSFEFDTPYGVASMVANGLGFAITTPLCIREAALPEAGLITAQLPGPQITRKLTLVARHRELGRIPRDLGEMARRVLLDAGALQ
ncbi:MAG: LysR family transcriptional regulator [Hyphomicrobium zavarzinii]|jgi:DNA-binding transcriptional LysR family regulator|uniref:LysR family transcriptional regulator n=1 Tax=Hyphomicrobium TaxID=81 RepID=UPI00058C8EAA|nr:MULTISPECIES: LysR family transcriptional regulator [Hyphomicrobium]MBL8845954.1 LysR family transcriptional regulator [Hyphomicrobium zavarzinii]WBT39784.1 LysR family transcriptional regulator [Hyphomicrobium sp. DMF-1]HML44073.1 LysR family transcriptional regulator [Hyphomicrobium zavarzinii]